MRRRRLLLATIGALVARLVRGQGADEYPKSGATLHYVVPFPPGGLTDVMARLVGQRLAERWKVNVIVDNRSGGGGQIGADVVAKAAGDGATLLAMTLTHAANVTLFPKSPYNLTRDLKPVALLAGSPMLVVVPAASPIKSFAELVASAKSRHLNAGSSGNGTPPHLMLALFNSIAKSDLQHVPYKGGAPSMIDLISGQLDVVFSNFPESIAHVKSGKLRALAIASVARDPSLPDVPTTAEAGMGQLVGENWTGVMVAAATPDLVVDKLSAELLGIMLSPDVSDRASALGFRVDARSAAKFAAFLDEEVQRWGRIIKAAHITAE